jgi:hypothetical protein
MIIGYILGLLITNSLLILWFFSPISSSIGKYFLKKDNIYVLDHLIDLIAIKSHFFATLLSCWICLSFWLSLIIGFIFTIINNYPYWFPILTYFSYPAILYTIKQLYR